MLVNWCWKWYTLCTVCEVAVMWLGWVGYWEDKAVRQLAGQWLCGIQELLNSLPGRSWPCAERYHHQHQGRWQGNLWLHFEVWYPLMLTVKGDYQALVVLRLVCYKLYVGFVSSLYVVVWSELDYVQYFLYQSSDWLGYCLGNVMCWVGQWTVITRLLLWLCGLSHQFDRLTVTNGIYSGQRVECVNDTSIGRSDSESCWWMVAQIFADHVLPPT